MSGRPGSPLPVSPRTRQRCSVCSSLRWQRPPRRDAPLHRQLAADDDRKRDPQRSARLAGPVAPSGQATRIAAAVAQQPGSAASLGDRHCAVCSRRPRAPTGTIRTGTGSVLAVPPGYLAHFQTFRLLHGPASRARSCSTSSSPRRCRPGRRPDHADAAARAKPRSTASAASRSSPRPTSSSSR